MRSKILILSLLVVIASTGAGYARTDGPYRTAAIYLDIDGGAKFWRTELYFGMGKPDGSEVTADEWAKFLADEVTPRFPAGFTVIESLGQYQGNDKKIVKEKSRIIVLLYEKKDRKLNDPKIEGIRVAYKKVFQQESVMRLDMRQSVTVSF